MNRNTLRATCATAIGILQRWYQPAVNESKENSLRDFVGSTEHYIGVQSYKGKDGYYIVYNNYTRNPLYAVEKLSRSTIENGNDKHGGKRPPFHAEQSITNDLFKVRCFTVLVIRF